MVVSIDINAHMHMHNCGMNICIIAINGRGRKSRRGLLMEA